MVLLQNSSILEKMDSKENVSWDKLVKIPFNGCDEKKQINSKAKERMLQEYEEKTGKKGSKRNLSRIPLWYFLHEILQVERCKSLISWESSSQLVFTIRKPKELAALWGQVKNKETMTYAKLARGIRYYYGKGVIEKYRGKRFSYQFIVSKKTSTVLKKSFPALTNVKQEVKEESCIDLKNKYATPSSSKYLNPRGLKRSLSNNSSDGSDRMSIASSDGSSDNENMNLDEFDNLDECLSDIFSDVSKMKDLFKDISMFEDDDVTTSSTENSCTLPNSNSLDFDFDIFDNIDYKVSSMAIGDMFFPKQSEQINKQSVKQEQQEVPQEHLQSLFHQKHQQIQERSSQIQKQMNSKMTLESIKNSLLFEQDYLQSTNNSSRINFYDNMNFDSPTPNKIPKIEVQPDFNNCSHEKLSRKKSKSESDGIFSNANDSRYYNQRAYNGDLARSVPDFSSLQVINELPVQQYCLPSMEQIYMQSFQPVTLDDLVFN